MRQAIIGGSPQVGAKRTASGPNADNQRYVRTT
jgi:hypothetical protein